MTVFYKGLKTYNFSWIEHTSLAREAEEMISDTQSQPGVQAAGLQKVCEDKKFSDLDGIQQEFPI